MNSLQETSETLSIADVLPIVDAVVAQMSCHLPPHVSAQDLASAGKLALMEVLSDFNGSFAQDRGYVVCRVRGAVMDEMRRLDPLSRYGRTQVRRVQHAVSLFEDKYNRVPTDAEVAALTGLTAAEVGKIGQLGTAAEALSSDCLEQTKPQQFPDVINALVEDSGVAEGHARQFLEELLQWISLSNKQLQDAGQRYTILPFKLHQFISQTGSVYTTLDQDENRFITLEPGLYKQDDADKKPIFTNVFSRSSGHPFICVSRMGNRLEPREFREKTEEDEEVHDGYLIVGEDVWNEAEDIELLPENWVRLTKAGLVPKTGEKKPFFPIKIHFDEYGNCSETQPKKWWGWFMKAPLLFDPTSGTFYDTKTNEGTKLTKLGSEGRSTSTTITTFSILNQLADAGFSAQDQKLLSFTDRVRHRQRFALRVTSATERKGVP